MSTASSYRRALVTGGAGFIGSHLSRRLLKEGLEVVVLDNLNTGLITNIEAGCEFIKGDLRNLNVVEHALKGVDIVFHNAARVSVRASNEQFVEDAETNVVGTLLLLKAIVAARVKKLVLASSMAVYDDNATAEPIDEDHVCRPLSPYGTGKLAMELYSLQLCGAHSIDVVPLRYFNTYGPGQAFTPYVGVVTIFATQLLQGIAPTIFGDGLQTRDFVSVHDIVQGNVCAMNASATGQVFNIGSGVGMTVREVAELLVEKIDPQCRLQFGPAQVGEIRNSIANIHRARSVLGYQPSGCFRDDIDEIIDGLRSKIITRSQDRGKET
jgi:nucleoside-diphosphate-sugar epimerase